MQSVDIIHNSNMSAIVPRDSDSLISTYHMESLNVSLYLSDILKANAWAEFMGVICGWTNRIKSNDSTCIYKVPITVPTATYCVENSCGRGKEIDPACIDNVPAQSMTYEQRDELVKLNYGSNTYRDSEDDSLCDKHHTMFVAIKLQRVLGESTEDDEVCKEIELLRKGRKGVHEGSCVHFPLVMAHITYKDMDGYTWYMIINRWMDGDLGTLFESDSKLMLSSHCDTTDALTLAPSVRISHTVKNAVVQTLMGMYTMNNIWNIFHNDLHPKNVLYVRLGRPVTFVYDIQDTADNNSVYRITLTNSNVFCLVWDFSKSSHESELCSNDFYDFFSQASDMHPCLTRHVRDVVKYSPSETLDVSSWIMCLLEHWSDDKHLCVEKFVKNDVTFAKLPHPCVYSRMYDNK